MRVPRRRNKSSLQEMKAAKLITALALLGLHGAVGDDLCAPASTSAARRVYAAAPSRAAQRVPPTQFSPSPAAVVDRGADGRADRAWLARNGVDRNSTLPSKPGTLQLSKS